MRTYEWSLLVILLAFLAQYFCFTPDLSTLDFVLPQKNLKGFLSGKRLVGGRVNSSYGGASAGPEYLTREELLERYYDDAYLTSFEPAGRRLRYTRNFISFEADLKGLMFCPLRPGPPCPIVLVADEVHEHLAAGKLLPFVEKFLVEGFCVITLTEMPTFPR